MDNLFRTIVYVKYIDLLPVCLPVYPYIYHLFIFIYNLLSIYIYSIPIIHLYIQSIFSPNFPFHNSILDM